MLQHTCAHMQWCLQWCISRLHSCQLNFWLLLACTSILGSNSTGLCVQWWWSDWQTCRQAGWQSQWWLCQIAHGVADDEQLMIVCTNVHDHMWATYLADTARDDLIYNISRLGLAFIALTFGLIPQYLLFSCKHGSYCEWLFMVTLGCSMADFVCLDLSCQKCLGTCHKQECLALIIYLTLNTMWHDMRCHERGCAVMNAPWKAYLTG